MTATNRRIISLLLSLLLVMSGPALAISKMAGDQAGATMTDCGSMMKAQAESADFSPYTASSDTASSDTKSNCASAADMACLSASGLSKCGVSVSFALLLGNSTGLTGAGSQPVLTAHAALYQDPFLAPSTPPPEHHS